jgi:hypothetical protein
MDVEIDAEGARVKPPSIRENPTSENPTSENPTSRTWAGSKGTQSLSHVNEIHPRLCSDHMVRRCAARLGRQ